MRIMLDVDEVVVTAARAKAAAEGTSIGRAVSDLALAGLKATNNPGPNGFPVMTSHTGHVITDELVARYRDD